MWNVLKKKFLLSFFLVFLIIIPQLFGEQDANLCQSDVKHANANAFLLPELFEISLITCLRRRRVGVQCANIMGRIEKGGGCGGWGGLLSSVVCSAVDIKQMEHFHWLSPPRIPLFGKQKWSLLSVDTAHCSPRANKELLLLVPLWILHGWWQTDGRPRRRVPSSWFVQWHVVVLTCGITELHTKVAHYIPKLECLRTKSFLLSPMIYVSEDWSRSTTKKFSQRGRMKPTKKTVCWQKWIFFKHFNFHLLLSFFFAKIGCKTLHLLSWVVSVSTLPTFPTI